MICGDTIRLIQHSCLRISQETLKNTRPFPRRACDIDIAGVEGDKDFTSMTRTREQNVESTLTAIGRDRSKIHAVETASGLAWSVPNGDENRVSLVTLNVLQIFDEYLLGSRMQVAIKHRIDSTALLEKLRDHIALRSRKGDDTE